MKRARAKTVLPIIATFLLAFTAIPLARMKGLELIPGDTGDSRLNNYFLENIFQFVTGGCSSLWHLGFFAPYPYVIGFSDNLFGASPIYLIARLITGESDTAFQVWFLAGYAANFAAALYAARRLGLSVPGATLAALIFAFALPTSAHMAHVQLHYRFGIPLATLGLLFFLRERRVAHLGSTALWITWQFYCGIYMGFFTLLLLSGVCLAFVVAASVQDPARIRNLHSGAWRDWKHATRLSKALSLSSLGVAVMAMAVLIFPYVQVSRLYAVSRSWGEIEPMLPRWRSYLMADAAWPWGLLSRRLPDVPVRYEHQMFVGVVPSLLAAAGIVILAYDRKPFGLLLAGGLGLMIALTLDIAGHSLWAYLYWLPLASAVRAMSRIDQVLLFPIGYLAGLAVDHFWKRQWGLQRAVGSCLVIVLVIGEAASVNPLLSSKMDWRARTTAIDAIYPRNVPASSIVFIAQRGEPIAHEIDVMWAALRHRNPTLNGYSGLLPPGFADRYGTGCHEIVRRSLLFQAFADRNELATSPSLLLNRVVPVGFVDCKPAQLSEPQQLTWSQREYGPDDFRQLSYRLVGVERGGERSAVSIALVNKGRTAISAMSRVNAPIRVSWRFLSQDGKALSGWDPRQDLPFDIPAHGELIVAISVKNEESTRNGVLQVSLVQEGRFWLHDVGISPLSIEWN